MADAVEERPVVRHGAGAAVSTTDHVVVEEPLEVRVAGETLAVTMRTPGEDRALAVGYLYAEGIVHARSDLGAVHHCGRPDEEGYGNVIDVLPAPGVAFDLDAVQGARRGTLTTSSCGVCGRRSVDDLLERIRSLAADHAPSLAVTPAAISAATASLRPHQPRFRRTGGLHAATLLDATGKVRAAAEDVGRHNAVDKAVGALLLEDRLDDLVFLAVSGRASFEIVQKAASAAVPVVVAVGAPSTLAIDLAVRAGVTLVGFSRDSAFTAYSHTARISGA